MDDNQGYPYFRKPPYITGSMKLWTCLSRLLITYYHWTMYLSLTYNSEWKTPLPISGNHHLHQSTNHARIPVLYGDRRTNDLLHIRAKEVCLQRLGRSWVYSMAWKIWENLQEKHRLNGKTYGFLQIFPSSNSVMYKIYHNTVGACVKKSF